MAITTVHRTALTVSISAVMLRGACSAPPPGSGSRAFCDALGSGSTSQRRRHEDLHELP
jgi:hypothetical protein